MCILFREKDRLYCSCTWGSIIDYETGLWEVFSLSGIIPWMILSLRLGKERPPKTVSISRIGTYPRVGGLLFTFAHFYVFLSLRLSYGQGDRLQDRIALSCLGCSACLGGDNSLMGDSLLSYVHKNCYALWGLPYLCIRWLLLLYDWW